MFDNLPNNNNSNEGENPAPRSIYPPMDGVSRKIDNRPRQANPLVKSAVDDIFSESEKNEKPQVFQPKSRFAPMGDQIGMTNAGAPYNEYESNAGNTKNKVMVLSLMFVSLLIVLVAGWYAYKMFFLSMNPQIVEEQGAQADNGNGLIENANNAPTGQEDNAADVQNANEQKSDVVAAEQPAAADDAKKAEEPTASKDSDGDGLTDDEEFQLGTNPNEVDSDNDGLFDREEVKVYKTNALQADTDKDGYTDGIEVKGGYNPNGAGKLYQSKQ